MPTDATADQGGGGHLLEMVVRYSMPCRRDALTDKEFRSIVEYHPAVRAALKAAQELPNAD